MDDQGRMMIELEKAGLSFRSRAVLASRYKSVADVLSATDSELLCLPNFGKHSLDEVRRVLGHRVDRVAELERELADAKTVLFWLVGDAEAWHRSWAQPYPPSDHEKIHLANAKRVLGDWGDHLAQG